MSKEARAAVEAAMQERVNASCARHGIHTIDLDCPPGGVRPWDLIAQVCEGTPLKPDTKPGGAFFGSREWIFQGFSCDEWDEIQKITRPRIEALYHSGYIRHGSW